MKLAAVIVLGTLVVGMVGCGEDPVIEPSSTGAADSAPEAPDAKAEVRDISSTSASTTSTPTSSTSSTTSIPVVDAPRTASGGG